MISLKNVGFITKRVEKRRMTIAELKLRMCKRYMKKENQCFIILSLDDGDRKEIRSIQEAIDLEWSDSCEIEIIGMPHSWGVKDDNGEMEQDAPTIIIIQMAASETDETVI